MGYLRDIIEVKELTDVQQVNALLRDGDWELLSTAPGQNAEKRPFILYCLGRTM